MITIHTCTRNASAMNVQRTLRRCLSSAADSRGTFSSTWRSVDANNLSATITPDPITYLQNFDASPTTSSYRAALLSTCSRYLVPGSTALDVGCGLGLNSAGLCALDVDVLGVDISERAIGEAKQMHAAPEFKVADVFSLSNDLPHSGASDGQGRYDVVLEDRVLQHLVRPLEAVKEMVQVTRPGGRVVCGEPDWRSFQMDVTGAGAGGASSAVEGVQAEAGRRWGESRRPPAELSFDMGALTTKMLNGAIPRLSAHSFIGISSSRLLRAAGLEDVHLEVVPLLFNSREILEQIVPITYFSRVLAVNQGAISAEEAQLWLDRLEWEAHENQRVCGVLNMYIASGRRPTTSAGGTAGGTTFVAGGKGGGGGGEGGEGGDFKRLPRICQLEASDAATERVVQVTDLINAAYNISDTGITLSTPRIPQNEVVAMIRQGEIFAAIEEGVVVGCIQVLVKGVAKHEDVSVDMTENEKEDQNEAHNEDDNGDVQQNAGLPATHSGPVGEFTCLAVHASFVGQGMGEALVRAAEAHARRVGCETMLLGVMCPNVPASSEPKYKQWLQNWYLKLGYDHSTTIELGFAPPRATGEHNEIDQLNDMYACLRQLVPCKAILMDKAL